MTSQSSTLSAPSPQEIRDELDSLVRRELLGPFGDNDEEIEETPTTRNLVGMLSPTGEETGADQNEDFATGGSDDGVAHQLRY